MPGVIRTYFLPQLARPDDLVGGTAVIIDQLRASTTICAALAAGAAGVYSFLEPEHAHVQRDSMQPHLRDRQILLGGERGGVRIPGFELGNSPAEYTPERVGGRDIYLTTTNGTKAVELCGRTNGPMVGCLGNLSALVDQIAGGEHAIHLICAGTREGITSEDILAAGAIAEGLIARGHAPSLADPRDDDDSTLIALGLWRSVQAEKGGIVQAMLNSRGGRNLCRVGLRDDVIDCARVDAYPIVPWLAPTGAFVDAATWV